MLNERKMFGSYFIYDGMDYFAVVATELEQINSLMNRFGIDFQVPATTSEHASESRNSEEENVQVYVM